MQRRYSNLSGNCDRRMTEMEANLINAENLKDGDFLGDGLVVSDRGNYLCAVYRCKCGREQKAACDTFSGGIGSRAARSVGWEMNRNEYGWTCPFCSGRTDMLLRVFKGANGS